MLLNVVCFFRVSVHKVPSGLHFNLCTMLIPFLCAKHEIKETTWTTQPEHCLLLAGFLNKLLDGGVCFLTDQSGFLVVRIAPTLAIPTQTGIY